MRKTSTLLLAATLAALSGTALAQVQQGSPNAANQALSNQSQTRAMQQNQTSQNNMNQMSMERSQAATPPPSTGPGMPAVRVR